MDRGPSGNDDGLTIAAPPDADLLMDGVRVALGGRFVEYSGSVDSLSIESGGGDDQIRFGQLPVIPPIVRGFSQQYVDGTSDNDMIHIDPYCYGGPYQVRVNGSLISVFEGGDRLIVHGLSGDDDIMTAQAVVSPVWLYGDDGNDRLRGGGGHDVLIGGDGEDLLVGNDGRDLLIGGRGSDRVVGNADDDILIAGYTAFDAMDPALAAVMAEWTSSRSYAERVKNLRGEQVGREAAFSERANAEVFLAVDGTHSRVTTLYDDDAADVLTGSAGQDWFLFNIDGESGTRKDEVTDLSAAEFSDDLAFINGQ
jgi:Ca2+-binding RTX toxin-like protein